MSKRPLVFLVPAATAAIYCAVCLELSMPLHIALYLLSFCLAAAGVWIDRAKICTLCCMLGAVFLAFSGFSIYQTLWVDPVRALAGRHAEITATVSEDAAVYEENQRAKLSVHDNDVLPRGFSMYCYLPLTETPLHAGDQVKVNVGFYLPNDTEGFDRAAYQASDGCYIAASYTKNEDDSPLSFSVTAGDPHAVRWVPQRIARFCRQAIEAALPEREASLLTGLLIGYTDKISPSDALSLRIAGLSHLVAVSGLHVGFLVAFCYLLFGRKLGSYLSIPLILLFVPIAGGSPSVLRAAIMYLIAAGAFITRREANTLNSLFAALALLLIQNPYAIGGLSLQLSFAATLGLVLLAGRMQEKLLRPFSAFPRFVRKLLSFVAGALSCTVCATVFTTPILLSSFGYVSLLSVLSNLLVIGVTAVGFIAGFLLCLASAVFPAAVPALAGLTQLPLRYILWVADRVSSIPFGMVNWGDHFGLAALMVFFAAVLLWLLAGSRVKWRFVLPAVCILLIALSGMSMYRYQQTYRVTYLPCGSGQAILLSDTRHVTLIDCAGDGGYRDATELIREWMRYHHVQKIDTLILTAVDKGHARDLPTLLESVEVGTIWMPDGCRETKYNADLLEVCAAYGAAEVEQAQTLYDGAAPVRVFPVADGKLGVQIAEEIAILHSPTQKQLAAYLQSGAISVPEVVLSQRNMEDEALLTTALDSLQAERLVVQAGFGEVMPQYNGIPVSSPYLSGEIERQFAKE